MKRIGTIMATITLLYACSGKPSSETVRNSNMVVLKEFLTASNQNNKTRLTDLLTDDFSYNYEIGGDTQGKAGYLNKVEYNFTTQDKLINTIDSKFESDSVMTANERIVTAVDTILNIDPRKIETRRYTFRNGKISNITHIDFVNITDYNTAFDKKMTPLFEWILQTYPNVKKEEIKDNIKTYLKAYTDTAVAVQP